jgi:ABC-2 type transport system ATP-binding protein
MQPVLLDSNDVARLWDSPLVVDRVTKVYRGGLRANDDVTLHVEPGEVYGLLGPNGAGKSTLVGQIIGLLEPNSGSIRLGEVDLVADPGVARQLCAYLPQAQLPIDSLRAEEAVELVGRMRGGSAADVRARRDALFAALDIDAWRHQMGASLSGGVKRLVGFVMAAIVPRPLVILDEPTNDVDPVRRRLLWEEIRALGAAGSAVLLVTHNVLEAERAVERLAMMRDGHIVAQGTPASLKSSIRGRLRLEVVFEPRAVEPALPGFAADPVRVGRRLMCSLDESAAGAAIAWAQGLTAAGVAQEFGLGVSSLEEVYVRLVGGEAGTEEGNGDE